VSHKHYLVIGASNDSAIGSAVCHCLAADGARLTLVGRRADALHATVDSIQGGDHIVAPYDLSNLDQIAAWLSSLVKQNGPFDGMIYSASFQGYSPLRGMSSSLITRYTNLNISAPLLLSKAFSKKSHYNPDASVLFIGSVAGSRGLKARSLYAGTKAALHSITQSLALELAAKSIRVNCVAPALVKGPQAEKQMKMLGEQATNDLLAAHPLGLSEPMDVAHAVAFLLSDRASNITGHILNVDGGYLAS
jgi:3-oxoacyl-[acyl-carrier protein] reductase